MKEYQIDVRNSGENCQEVVKDFLFKRCATVRFSSITWGWILKKGGVKDPNFQKTLSALKPFYLEEEVLERRIGELQGFIDNKSHNYYYRLSDEMKAKLREEDLLFGCDVFEISKNFYGFEDPTFLDKDDYIVGKFISHESYIFLFLEPSEKQALIKQGIEFF